MHASEIASLRDSIPCLSPGLGPDDQLRAVLRDLLDLMTKPVDVRPIAANPSKCPNCGKPTDNPKSPYCSEHCREMAGFIRQFRSALQNGSIESVDRQAAFGQKLWNLRGGGFPRRQLIVPARVVAKVIERDGGKCQVCGAPATGIDHTGSG